MVTPSNLLDAPSSSITISFIQMRCLQDQALIVIVFAMLVPVLLVLTVWTIVAPLSLTEEYFVNEVS